MCFSLSSLDLGNSVEQIGSLCFQYCCGLKSVTIPASLNYLTYGTFNDCESLTAVEFEATDGWYVKSPWDEVWQPINVDDSQKNAAVLLGPWKSWKREI